MSRADPGRPLFGALEAKGDEGPFLGRSGLSLSSTLPRQQLCSCPCHTITYSPRCFTPYYQHVALDCKIALCRALSHLTGDLRQISERPGATTGRLDSSALVSLPFPFPSPFLAPSLNTTSSNGRSGDVLCPTQTRLIGGLFGPASSGLWLWISSYSQISSRCNGVHEQPAFLHRPPLRPSPVPQTQPTHMANLSISTTIPQVSGPYSSPVLLQPPGWPQTVRPSEIWASRANKQHSPT
jgi:hypothetical protein